MSNLYWITVLGNLSNIGIFLAIAGGLCVFISLMVKDVFNNWKRLLKISSILALLGFLFVIFIPSKHELYMIYGVGNTIDYLKNNSTVKQLPDKYIKILDKWADEQLSVSNNEDKIEITEGCVNYSH